jgi:hypothetical protein
MLVLGGATATCVSSAVFSGAVATINGDDSM